MEKQQLNLNIVKSNKQNNNVGTNTKLLILIWLALQNSINSLLLRYSRIREVKEIYYPTVAVFWMEIIKVSLCLLMVYCMDCSEGIFETITLLKKNIFGEPINTLKVGLPAILYIFQNNLLYIAASHLDAATFMIVSQLKIFTTAIFSIVMLKRSISQVQWLSLFVLFIGVCLVQMESGEKNESATIYLNREQNASKGLLAICLACILSGFSGVYFEKILKNSTSVSVWIRNIQMAIFSLPASVITMIVQDGGELSNQGLMYGWDWVVWLTAGWIAIGGLSVAVCIKYANNIAKDFATSAAIILSTIVSIYAFGFQPGLFFIIGSLLVMIGIFLYSSTNLFKIWRKQLKEKPTKMEIRICHNSNT